MIFHLIIILSFKFNFIQIIIIINLVYLNAIEKINVINFIINLFKAIFTIAIIIIIIIINKIKFKIIIIIRFISVNVSSIIIIIIIIMEFTYVNLAN